MTLLTPFAAGIYIYEYPIHFAGCHFMSKMTIVQLSTRELMIHSPSEITDELKAEIGELGKVKYIVAPGNYHHLHIPSCQRAFPLAQTMICPRIETKRKDLKYDGILKDSEPLDQDLEQVLIEGNRIINEVAFLHKPSKTLIVVDSIEYIGDNSAGVHANWVLRFWWKYLMGMWNVAKPAPEYQMGWKDRTAARASMERILQWDFDKVIMSHGENFVTDAPVRVRQAWKSILGPVSEDSKDLTPRQKVTPCC